MGICLFSHNYNVITMFIVLIYTFIAKNDNGKTPIVGFLMQESNEDFFNLS